MPSIEVIPFDDASEFFEYLSPTNPEWESDLRMPSCPWVFRGQCDSDWHLLPRAWRPDGQAKLKELVEGFKEFIENELSGMLDDAISAHGITDEERFVRLMAMVAAEHDAVWRFVALGDELGLFVSRQDKLVPGLDYLQNFDPNCWPKCIPLDAFGLAQHHGIPTRLLDWTRAGKIAAFFAAQLPDPPIPDRIAVWALNLQYLLNEGRDAGLHVMRHPRYANSFLHHQDGLFTSYDKGDIHYYENHEWPDLESIVDAPPPSGGLKPLVKLTLPSSQVQALTRILWRHRVSKAHLMPTFDNVVSSVEELWKVVDNLRMRVTAYGV